MRKSAVNFTSADYCGGCGKHSPASGRKLSAAAVVYLIEPFTAAVAIMSQFQRLAHVNFSAENRAVSRGKAA